MPIAFLSRHDKGHRISTSDINCRANIDVLKRTDVTDLVSLSACGSLKERFRTCCTDWRAKTKMSGLRPGLQAFLPRLPESRRRGNAAQRASVLLRFEELL
jgi:hypothetical protein